MKKNNFFNGSLKENRRGWIRIIEAFTAVLLIAGVSLLVINEGNITGIKSSKVYDLEISIIQEIQHSNDLRDAVLDATLPVEWEDFDSEGLTEVKNKIYEKSESYLECEAKLCELDDACVFSKTIEKNVYAQRGFFSASASKYSPRQLKIFCWEK
ncbi:MAG: hypothetical protein ABH804_00830 [archaeon]